MIKLIIFCNFLFKLSVLTDLFTYITGFFSLLLLSKHTESTKSFTIYLFSQEIKEISPKKSKYIP
jgi:hypothetical protein